MGFLNNFKREKTPEKPTFKTKIQSMVKEYREKQVLDEDILTEVEEAIKDYNELKDENQMAIIELHHTLQGFYNNIERDKDEATRSMLIQYIRNAIQGLKDLEK
jgi:hypothetical protein